MAGHFSKRPARCRARPQGARSKTITSALLGSFRDDAKTRDEFLRLAHAPSSRDPLSNGDHYKAVSYGSSHIQAIAFGKHGRVNARTILTYGQAEDQASPWSSDQTRMFSQKKWVHFAFTPRQIRNGAISREVVSARR